MNTRIYQIAPLVRQPILSLKVSLGRVNCSNRATAILDEAQLNPFNLFHRWQEGNWDKVESNHAAPEELFQQNSKALAAQLHQERIVGIYPISPEPTAGEPDSRERIWISGCPFAGKGANTTILMVSEF